MDACPSAGPSGFRAMLQPMEEGTFHGKGGMESTKEDGFYRWRSGLNLRRNSIVRLTGPGLNVELPVLVA